MSGASILLPQAVESISSRAAGMWTLAAAGVTRSETLIPALVHRNAHLTSAKGPRLMLLGGLSGREADVRLVLRTLEAYLASGENPAKSVILSAVPCGNPDGLEMRIGPGNGASGTPGVGYPPKDSFFDNARDPEARYLWRWTNFEGPDLLLEVRAGGAVGWEATDPASPLAQSLGATKLGPPDSLLAAMAVGTPNGLGLIPGIRLTSPLQDLDAALEQLWSTLNDSPGLTASAAHAALDARRSRSPLEVAKVLASVYGHSLDSVVYTEGVAISGRLRLALLDPTGDDPVPDIVDLVAPCLSGAKPYESRTDADAGLIWGNELGDATGDRRYADLVVGVADRYRPGVDGGAPYPNDPDFRTEDMFMGGAMLGRAYAITGERRYLDIQTRGLLDAHVQQEDGLFWHCRSSPYYWGRGNGFAALGFAETLTYLPDDHPDRAAVLAMHVRHLDGLRRHQSPSGMFLQVIDFPGSYQELTATCMIGYAIARGLRRGWLGSSFRDKLMMAWQGASERVDNEGNIVDGCTGTGPQEDLRGYLDRPAIVGFDHRTGSMAIWFATEMERLLRESG